jgi:hypothetical protein
MTKSVDRIKEELAWERDVFKVMLVAFLGAATAAFANMDTGSTIMVGMSLFVSLPLLWLTIYLGLSIQEKLKEL